MGDLGLGCADRSVFAVNKRNNKLQGKGKAIPLQAWTGPEGPRRLRLPDVKIVGM
jgi:hypothetical protein